MGDGFLGDIAIDEVTLSTASCNTVPNFAKPGVSSLSGKCLIKKCKSFNIRYLCGIWYKWA